MTKLKDIPKLAGDGSNLPAVIEAVREALQTFRGYRGDKMDRALTPRDFKAGALSGLLGGVGGTVGTVIGGGTGSTGGAPVEKDLTAPPTATGLDLTAGISNLFVRCDAQVYPQGHGHDLTVVFGAKWPSNQVDPPVFGDAVELWRFRGQFSAYPSDPMTRWRVWIKWLSVDGVMSVDPSDPDTDQTAVNVDLLQQALVNKITRSQLFADLGTTIDLIEAPENIAGSVAARIKAERDRAEEVEGAHQETLVELSDAINDPATGLQVTAQAIGVVRTVVESTAHGNLALAERADALEVKAGELDAAVADEALARVSGDTALAQRVTTVAASSVGGSLTADPFFRATAEHWLVRQGTIDAEGAATSGIGKAVYSAPGAYLELQSRNAVAVDLSRTYRATGGIWRGSAAAPRSYLAVELRDVAGAPIPGAGSTNWLYIADNVDPGNSLTTYTALFGAGTANTIPSNAVSMHVVALLSYTTDGPAGVSVIESLRIESADADRVQEKLSAQVQRIDDVVIEVGSKASAQSVQTVDAKLQAGGSTFLSIVLSQQKADAGYDTAILAGTAAATAQGAASAAQGTANTAKGIAETAAGNVTTLQSQMNSPTLGNNPVYAALIAEQNTRASETGDLFAQATLKLDLNGYITGWGLASTVRNGVPSSSFIIRAADFSIASPTGPGITPIVPFVVNTVPTAEPSGVMVPAGVWIDGAFIRNLTAPIARLGQAWIDDAMVGNMSANKLTVGDGVVGGVLRSANYFVSPTLGWLLGTDGVLRARGGEFAGTITATAGSIGGILIDANGIRTDNYDGSHGFFFGANGTISIDAAGIRGKLTTNQIEVGSVTDRMIVAVNQSSGGGWYDVSSATITASQTATYVASGQKVRVSAHMQANGNTTAATPPASVFLEARLNRVDGAGAFIETVAVQSITLSPVAISPSPGIASERRFSFPFNFNHESNYGGQINFKLELSATAYNAAGALTSAGNVVAVPGGAIGPSFQFSGGVIVSENKV